MWNPSYCAVTVSDRSRDQIMAYIEGQKEKEKTKVGDFIQIVSSYGVEINTKEYTAPLYAGYFSESSFLSDSSVCRDVERTFRNQESTKTL